ncbi:hypothetical protein BTVI_101871 [Pitangus sulphuratus]|nr:hypothetical protein BTVI_101871 [Pitangus sulphuratus]
MGRLDWTLQLLDPLSTWMGNGCVAKLEPAGTIADVPRGKATMSNQQQDQLPGRRALTWKQRMKRNSEKKSDGPKL